MKEVMVSIIIPILNEQKFIKELLLTINRQSYPLDEIEVILIDGGSTDNTINVINELSKSIKYHLILLHNEKKVPVTALNMGLKNAKGKIVMRLDAHSNYESRYIEKIVSQLINSKEYCNVGGVAKAVGYDNISNAIATVLNSPIGVGGAKFRYAKQPIETDSLFPGAWWKSDLIRINGWNENWIVNEDAELNIRLKKETNRKIMIIPDINLEYYPRNSFGKLTRQYFRYGYWRNKTSVEHPESMRLSHIIPPYFIITLLVLFLLKFFYIFLLVTLFYFLLILTFSIKFVAKKNINFSYIILSILITHFSWGAGAIVGYVKFGLPFKGFWNTFKSITIYNYNKFSRLTKGKYG